ncbi:MAG: methyltransferase domain-containing protein [Deltaproteobacteria bacterium]|nr:methyltransferase domain-containing protein [Deltaproteobacteria bacterium]
MSPALAHWYEELFDGRYLAFYELGTPLLHTEEADLVDRALALPRQARLLDLGCGTGRHAVALALLGHHVTGVDLSPALLARAQGLARQHGAALDLVRRDMRDLAGLGPFDACVCLYTVLGYFDDEGNAAVLRAVREVLAPGGALVLDIGNPLARLARPVGETWREVAAGVTREISRYDPLAARLAAERTIFHRDGRREELPPSSVRLYAPHETARLLESAGFAVEQLHGGLRGEKFAWNRSRCQVWVARRK